MLISLFSTNYWDVSLHKVLNINLLYFIIIYGFPMDINLSSLTFLFLLTFRQLYHVHFFINIKVSFLSFLLNIIILNSYYYFKILFLIFIIYNILLKIYFLFLNIDIAFLFYNYNLYHILSQLKLWLNHLKLIY